MTTNSMSKVWDGYYIIQFTYKDVSNPLYVKCEIPIYPSDME